MNWPYLWRADDKNSTQFFRATDLIPETPIQVYSKTPKIQSKQHKQQTLLTTKRTKLTQVFENLVLFNKIPNRKFNAKANRNRGGRELDLGVGVNGSAEAILLKVGVAVGLDELRLLEDARRHRRHRRSLYLQRVRSLARSRII